MYCKNLSNNAKLHLTLRPQPVYGLCALCEPFRDPKLQIIKNQHLRP